MIESYQQGRERQREAAASRVAERTGRRREHAAALAGPGGLAAADRPSASPSAWTGSRATTANRRR